MEQRNIFSNLPAEIPEEIFEEVLTARNCRVERIVSFGHSTPQGQWYDQAQNEWVIVLKGNARLSFEGEDGLVMLGAGDYVNIPAHTKHRVEWTDQNQETIWLAIHYS